MINYLNLKDKKFNKRSIKDAFKNKLFHDYNRGVYVQVPEWETLAILGKAHLKYMKWPISPKFKESQFKRPILCIIHFLGFYYA